MSEMSPEMSVFGSEFEMLESTMTDPYIESVLTLARQYNDILKNTTPTAEEKEAIINELDSEWGSALHMPMKITGHISARDGEDVIEKAYYEDLDVISNGFCITEDQILIDDEVVAVNYVVKHHFLVPGNRIAGLNSDSEDFVGATGEVDDVILELPTASMERATAWLTENYPEVIQDIDERILNAEGTEADSILALRGFELSPALAADTDFARNCVIVYISQSLQLDQYVPYSVNLSGKVHLHNDDGTMSRATIKTGSSLAVFRGITMTKYNEEENDNYEIFVIMNLITEDRTAGATNLNVPLDTIHKAMSIRAAFYDD